jgi:hypothetical protein
MTSEQFLDSFLNLELLTDEQLIRLRDRSENILNNRKRRNTTKANTPVTRGVSSGVILPREAPQIVPSSQSQPLQYLQPVTRQGDYIQQPIEYLQQIPILASPVSQNQYIQHPVPQQLVLSPNNIVYPSNIYRY